MSLTQEQKDRIRTNLENILAKTLTEVQFSRIVWEIEIRTADPLPEQILTCIRCGKTITAYGTKGESFITEHRQGGDIHYHGDPARCLQVQVKQLL